MALENYYSEHESKTIDRVIREADAHHKNSVVHVTQAERESWNGKAAADSVAAVATQLANTKQTLEASIANLEQNTTEALSQKMNAGQLQELANLQYWQVQMMLAYTIGFRKDFIGYKKMTSYASNMIFPLVKYNGKFMISRTGSTSGTYIQESNFMFGAVTMNNVVIEGNLYGNFGEWYDIPRQVTMGGNMFYVILLCEEDFDYAEILMKNE